MKIPAALAALLFATTAAAAPDPAARARFVNFTDLAQLTGTLHKEAEQCGLSKKDDPFFAPGGKLHTALLRGLKSSADAAALNLDRQKIAETAAAAYAKGRATPEKLFTAQGCTPEAKEKIAQTKQWLLQTAAQQ
ncbi:hypothetical protein HMPREF9120_02446 [Neisseria sp. oral taxon 020 str. F0370]|uniref:hypothetical protein n=1 Tax=unclassified Neisseria TaxID=2623750 RepID=UPI0002A2F021|nr:MULTISPECIES: hypothetical protein [unclassified Neisseria]ASP17329.1 hypothetical protein CGZ77_05965 [Neisseria sp. KEM232]EKY04149.1 hypothetical protein HMPREF9120_02446 [Neisseria sp. oral taxon 020 str. F0370]